METLQIIYQPIKLSSPLARLGLLLTLAGLVSIFVFVTSFKLAIIISLVTLISLCFIKWLALKSTVSYTLTATHFQQHLFKGGWVVKWNNIVKIGVCHCDQQGWQQPLPWIGIKLKNYSPYLDSICPRIATDILLSQRALLYIGMKQSILDAHFEDIVLDSQPYKNEQGSEYKGLQAMLANRMRHQRNYFDYDIFISAQDIDRTAEEFVGLARRYLAAAERQHEEQLIDNKCQ
ncbi:hypothetical protein GCM10007938_23900 [Vibrio zhanjiangensis]|uniref:DUF2982 domain-containing protein n=1 Tax=Vibrio zhanjiangensis TaxID=1046128 RepID=A0ABQ6F104_9VIBR|nr:DUF2982 domain-containing protein [Vibrio zhanjiangensis]GLT18611.1 hypothetical protein GCM10007938_23900 [Vibrio zhanjiangensis]